MDYVLVFHKCKKYVFQRGPSWNFQSMLGNGLVPGGKEKDKARQAVKLTNPFGNDPEEEAPHDDLYNPTASVLRNSLETPPRCCILGTIAKSPGSRITILANENISNHAFQNNTRRLH